MPAKIEFVDNFVIRRIEEKMHIGLPVDANTMLLIDADGSRSGRGKRSGADYGVAQRGRRPIARLAKDEDEANMYWKARSAGFAAIYSAARTVIAEDVTVPRDRLSDFIKKLDEISKKSGFRDRSHRTRGRWKYSSQRLHQQPGKGRPGSSAGYLDGDF